MKLAKLISQIIVVITIMVVSNSSHAFKVLFIGNSFVGFSMPTLDKFAQASPLGEDVFGYEFIGGISLIEHSEREETLLRIRSKRWDYIVLQDHSLQSMRDPEAFENGIELLVREVRNSGAEPILFMTWARIENPDYLGEQSVVSKAYLDAAKTHNTAIAHVGEVYQNIYLANRNLFFQMYQSDRIHPTGLGAFAVAASIYSVMYDDSLEWASSIMEGAGAQLLLETSRKINMTRESHRNRFQVASLLIPSVYLELLQD